MRVNSLRTFPSSRAFGVQQVPWARRLRNDDDSLRPQAKWEIKEFGYKKELFDGVEPIQCVAASAIG